MLPGGHHYRQVWDAIRAVFTEDQMLYTAYVD